MTTITVPSGTDSIVFLDEEGAVVSMTDASGNEYTIDESVETKLLPEPYLLAWCKRPRCKMGKDGRCRCRPR